MSLSFPRRVARQQQDQMPIQIYYSRRSPLWGISLQGVVCDLAITIVLGVFLGGCTTLRKTETPRTASQQLLISTAAERSAEQLALNLPADTKVFVDSQYFEGMDSKYAVGAIRDRLLKHGARLVDEKKDADVVLEIRSGALSVDDRNTLVGIPSFSIPVPLAGPLQFPEIALFKSEEEQGVSKVAMTGYETKTGALKVSSGPVYGLSHRRRLTVLFFFSWSADDLPRKENGDETRRTSD
jgi:hypothetical protein